MRSLPMVDRKYPRAPRRNAPRGIITEMSADSMDLHLIRCIKADAVAVIDDTTRVHECSVGYVKLSGLAREDIVGHGVSDIVRARADEEPAVETFCTAVAAAVESGRVQSIYRLSCPYAESVYWNAFISALPAPGPR